MFLVPLIGFAQHTIKGTFSPAEDYNWAILYRITPSNTFYTTDTKVDSAGNFTLQLDTTVTKGVYRLAYATPLETYNFDFIYNAEEDVELTFNESDGVKFVASKENILLSSYEKETLSIRTEIGNKYRKEYSEVGPLFEILKELQGLFEKAAAGTIALHFIKATRTYIPTEPEGLDTYIKKTKANYFKNIDFNNPTLQKSSFLIESSFNYINGFVNKEGDVSKAYEKNVDTVFEFLQHSDKEFQKALLLNLWQKFVNLDDVHTANYIASTYLIPVSTVLMDFDLVEKLALFKNISLGEKAPDFAWKEDKNGRTSSQSLYTLESAENYIVVFWSSACSHCLKEIPLLHETVKGLEEGNYKVIAVGLEDEPYDWENKIHEFPKFINVLGLGKWENKIGNDYGIDATPTYFVLDKDKKIIAKPEDIEELIEIIQK